MKTADALMVLYYVVLSGVLVFTRSFKKNSAPDCRGFFSDSDLSVPESGCAIAPAVWPCSPRSARLIARQQFGC